MFKKQTITTIHIWSMAIMSVFVVLFITLVIYEEYNDFDREAKHLREGYLQKQKERIKYDTHRVVKYINHTYQRTNNKNNTILKKEIINAIEHLYGRPDGTGYIFIYDFNGTNISDPIQPSNQGKNLYMMRDVAGVQVIKELIDISRLKDGGFIEYVWMKPTSKEQSPKISYAKSFETWSWMVGTGVYLDEVEKLIAIEKVALKKRLIKLMMEILSLSIILFGLGIIALSIVNHIINKEIETFSLFFKKASKGYSVIKEEQIHLLEFKKMVKYINIMVAEIHKRKEKLKTLNLSLEATVAQKTHHLNELVKTQDSFIKHSIHEINTPLAVIMTHIDIYEMKYGKNRYLSKIEAGAKMISTIYDDLGYMVKKDRLEYQKSKLNFSTFLKQRIEFFSQIASGNHHKIIPSIQEDIMLCFNDIELQRVIDNNLSNAIKFAKKNSDITIKLTAKDDSVLLDFITYSAKIADTKRIFEAFHREASNEIGFGLGLEIVASICNKEQVMVCVDSDEVMTLFSYKFRSKI